MNMKKFAVTGVVVFVALWITEFVFHGMLMKDQYAATAQLWRPESEMGAYFPFMIIGQLVTAFLFTAIFIHGYKGKGAAEGVRYGILMGGFMAGFNLSMYAVAPWTPGLLLCWTVFGFVQSAFLGVICTFVYKA